MSDASRVLHLPPMARTKTLADKDLANKGPSRTKKTPAWGGGFHWDPLGSASVRGARVAVAVAVAVAVTVAIAVAVTGRARDRAERERKSNEGHLENRAYTFEHAELHSWGPVGTHRRATWITGAAGM